MRVLRQANIPTLRNKQKTRWSEVTESMVTPCCGYSLVWCLKLKGEDLWSCWSPYIKLNQLVYENVHTTTRLPISVFKRYCYCSNQHFSEFYLQDGGKNRWYGTKLRHCQPMYRRTGGDESTQRRVYSRWWPSGTTRWSKNSVNRKTTRDRNDMWAYTHSDRARERWLTLTCDRLNRQKR